MDANCQLNGAVFSSVSVLRLCEIVWRDLETTCRLVARTNLGKPRILISGKPRILIEHES
jgi:hypothetical protein